HRFRNNKFLRLEPDLDPKVYGQTETLQKQVDDNFSLLLAKHRLDMKAAAA
uniref:mS108 n=1 Tax=Polytomella magna TaxID=353565 RepID=UPI002240E50C|nr:Chain Yb, mS108 [Polytomella magna]8APN_Yb Chain Yb, mS108 [Polytomella magna]8APO_Yb Chain Yb, mS108 [Polytomella magna]